MPWSLKLPARYSEKWNADEIRQVHIPDAVEQCTGEAEAVSREQDQNADRSITALVLFVVLAYLSWEADKYHPELEQECY